MCYVSDSDSVLIISVLCALITPVPGIIIMLSFTKIMLAIRSVILIRGQRSIITMITVLLTIIKINFNVHHAQAHYFIDHDRFKN